MEFLGILIGLLKLALVVGGIVLIVRATRSKGEMGINLKRVICCQCGADVPAIRKPKDKEEFMWGGWTCGNCGQQMDKWGKPRGDHL